MEGGVSHPKPGCCQTDRWPVDVHSWLGHLNVCMATVGGHHRGARHILTCTLPHQHMHSADTLNRPPLVPPRSADTLRLKTPSGEEAQHIGSAAAIAVGGARGRSQGGRSQGGRSQTAHRGMIVE